MARSPRLLRTIRMFVDTEDCAERCIVSQVVVHVSQFADGSCDAVISSPEDPSRRIVRQGVNTADLAMFLQFASALNAQPTA